MTRIRAGVAALLTLVAVVLLGTTPAPSSTALVTGVAVVVLAAMLVRHAAVLTARSYRAVASITAFIRRQARLPRPAPQHPDTAGRPRTRAPSMGFRAS